MGYHSRATVHGFRSMASTALNEMGFRPDVIERQLAHQEQNVARAAYNRAEYLNERRAMMKRWADHLEAENVVPFKSKIAPIPPTVPGVASPA
jgi:integrase